MSWHCDSTERFAGAWLTSAYAGAGIAGVNVPSTGANGPSDLYPPLTLPADNAVEVNGITLTVPSVGTFVRQENGEWTFSGAPAGVYTYSFGLSADYVFVGNVTNSITVGGPVQISCSLVADDAVISAAFAAGSSTTDISLALQGGDAVISAAFAVGSSTTDISLALQGGDAIISASLYVPPVVNTVPGTIPSSTTSTRHSLKRLAAATETCVTLAEAKAQCRVDGSDENFLITAYIHAATEAAEQIAGRAIMPQIWQLTHDGMPAFFELTRPNVLSIVSLTYIDTNGIMQTLPSTNYALDDADDIGFAYVVPAWGVSWPATGGQMNSAVLTYQAGYASAAQVPASVKAWVLLMTASLYANRELEGTQQTYGLGRADVLLETVKVWSI